MTHSIRKKLPQWFYPAIVFALVVFAVYFPLVQGKVPFPSYIINYLPAFGAHPTPADVHPVANIGDIVTQFYPYRTFTASSVRNGTLPLWNPYLLSGVTFVGNCLSALFYPPNIVYYLIPLPVAWTVAVAIRLFMAAMFMWLFLKSIGATPAGAIFGGLVFSCCGFMTIWQGQTMADSSIWLPLVFYAIHRLHRDMSARSLVLTAFGFAMPVLAGMPEIALYITIAGTAWALLLFVFPSGDVRRSFDFRFLSLYMGSGLLAIGLAAIQIIPTLEWLRELGHVLATVWPPNRLSQAVAFVSRDILRHPNSAGIDIPEAAAYIGMTSFLLVPLAVFHGERKHVAFFGAMILISVGVVYGFEPFRWVSMQLPIIKAIKNGRLLFLASFGIAVMAATGLSALEKESSHRRRILQFLMVLGSFAFSLLLVHELRQMTVVRIEAIRRPSFSRALLFLSFIPIAVHIWGRFPRRLFPWVVCSIAAFDLITFSYGAAGFSDQREIFPKAPLFDFLKQTCNPLQCRIAQVGNPYHDNTGMIYGLSSVDGYELAMKRFTDFAEGYSVETDGLHFSGSTYFSQDDRRLDMLNVQYIVISTQSPEYVEFGKRMDRYARVYEDVNVTVFQNKQGLARFFAVPIAGVEVMPLPQQIARIKEPSFNPERSVVVTEEAGIPALSHTVPLESTVEVLAADVNGYTLRTDTSAPAILVASQTRYPGWKAVLDGNEIPVFAADFALSGFVIPQGKHDVRFVYQPTSLKIGMLVSAFSVLSALVLIVRSKS